MNVINRVKIKDLDLSFIILNLNNNNEASQYFELFENCFGKRNNISTDTFTWFNLKKPNENFNFAFIDNKNMSMIAAYGLAPVSSYFKGLHTPAVLCTNVMTDPKYAGNGLFTEIGSLSLAHVFEKKEIKLAYGIPNENAIRGHLKVGWKEMPPINFYEKQKSDIVEANIDEIHYKSIAQFDKSINDRLFDFYQKYDFYIQKDTDFLNWRFSKPFQTYEKIVLLEDEIFQGYIVYKFYNDIEKGIKKLQIVDFLFNKLDHMNKLLKVIDNIAYNNKVDLINLWVTAEQNIFENNTYKLSEEKNMLIFFSEDEKDFNGLSNIHITLADNDVF